MMAVAVAYYFHLGWAIFLGVVMRLRRRHHQQQHVVVKI
jgi:hypothetical protein